MSILDPVKFFGALILVSILGQGLGFIEGPLNDADVYTNMLTTIWMV